MSNVGARSERDAPLRESGAALALLLTALAGFWLHTHYLHRHPVDDAAISVAYARTFSEGAGLRITPYSQAAEGYSNPSWTFLLSALELLGFDSLAWLRPLGMAFAAAALVLVTLWGPLAERRRLQVEDGLVPLIAAAHPSFVHWSQGGLELGIQSFGIALLGALALTRHDKGTAVAFGACAALVTLTRPEGALYAVAMGAIWLGKMLVERRRPGALELRALVVAALPVLVYLAFRRWYFGMWLPNTYYAKQGWDFGVHGYLRSFYDAYRPLCLVTLLAVPVGLLGTAHLRLRALCGALAVGSLVYFAYFARGDWMMEWRFLALIAPFQGALVGCAISALRQLAWRSAARASKLRMHAASLATATGVLASVYAAYELLPSELVRSEIVKSHGSDVSAVIAKGAPYVPVRDALESLGMRHPLLMASDMGVVGLGLRQAELWDFAGLTDPALSRQFNQRGGLQFQLVEDYLRHEGPPTIVLAWGPGQFFRVLGIARDYEEFAPAHFRYKGLSSEHDPRCPDGKGAVLSQDAAALARAILSEAQQGEPVRALARYRCAHSYAAPERLPSMNQRVELAERAEQLAHEAEQNGMAELALRHYSLCAVLSLHHTGVSLPCRYAAEKLRVRLLGKKPPEAIAR